MTRKPRWHDETCDASKPTARASRLTPVDPIPLVTEPDDQLPIAEVRRYAILGEVAQGGIGRIFEAEDRTLKRRVAIKELIENRGHARFLREAMITARLQHPSIVPLYDVGRWPSGEPYYSMRLVAGRPLDAVIAASKSLDERLALLPHVIAVADAMAYAHSERIIHRDLKPANVLVGEFGETVVIDWGLAKDLVEPEPELEDGPYRLPDAPPPLTQAGDVLGTPVYMAPEQAMGKPLDQRADVYAIGAILYELLSGRWPHHGSTPDQVITRLTAGEPVTAIELRQPDVPADLATIVTKAMAHDLAERYPSAGELATDLRRFQTGQLVAAHRYSRATLIARWIRRHRAVVGVTAVLLAALAITAVASVRSIVRERNATRAERDRLILANAAGELARDPTAAVAWLKTYPTSGAEPERARTLAIDARARGVATHVLARDLTAAMGKFSPDGRHYAQPGPTGLRVIELATGSARGPQRTANAVQWSPDGTRLAIADGAQKQTSVLELATGTVTPIPAELGGRLAYPAFSGAGQAIVLPVRGGGLRRFANAADRGELQWTPFPLAGFARHEDRFLAMADGALTWWDREVRVAHPLAVPAGITLDRNLATSALIGTAAAAAAATTDGQLIVWSLPDGNARVLVGSGVAITELAVSRDGTHAVTLASDSSLRVWSLATGTSRALPALGEITDFDLAADASMIVAGLSDHQVVVVDLSTGDQRVVGKHGAEVRGVRLSPEGGWIASDSDDGTTRLWQLRGELGEQPPKSFGLVSTIAGAPDARIVVIGGDRGAALLWTGARRVELPGHAEGVSATAVSADGARIATAGFDRKIRLWDATGAAGQVLDAPGQVLSLALTRDGRSVVACLASGEIRVWDAAGSSSRLLATIRDAKIPALAFDDRSIAVGGVDGSLTVLALDGSSTRTLPGAAGMVDYLTFSPDGRHVVGGSSWHGQVRLWDLATRTTRELGRRKGGVTAVAFSSDARWVAASSVTGDVGLWDVATVRERTLEHGGDVGAIGFTADAIVTGAMDGAVRLWSFDGRERSRLRVDGAVLALAVRDRQLVAGTSAGEVYRWRIAALGESPATGQPLAPFLAALTHARLDAGSRALSP
ncbi:MAG: protein kinase [Kofleriaceae bacterium]